jgi:hypothetical protein
MSKYIIHEPVWINFFPGNMRDERGFEFSAEPAYAPEDLKGFVDSIIRGCTSSMDCSDAETLLNALPALACWFCSTVDNRTKQQQAQLDAVQELSEALKEAAQDNGPRQPMMPGRGEAESSQEANMDQQVLIARNLRGVQVGDTLRVERGQVFRGAEKASFDLTSRVAPDGKYVVRAKCGRAPGDVSYYG